MCIREFIPPEDCAVFSVDCEVDDCRRPTVALVKVGGADWQALCPFHGAADLYAQATMSRIP